MRPKPNFKCDKIPSLPLGHEQSSQYSVPVSLRSLVPCNDPEAIFGRTGPRKISANDVVDFFAIPRDKYVDKYVGA